MRVYLPSAYLMSSNICQYCAALRSNAEMQPYSSKVHVTDQGIWGDTVYRVCVAVQTSIETCNTATKNSVNALEK